MRKQYKTKKRRDMMLKNIVGGKKSATSDYTTVKSAKAAKVDTSTRGRGRFKKATSTDAAVEDTTISTSSTDPYKTG